MNGLPHRRQSCVLLVALACLSGASAFGIDYPVSCRAEVASATVVALVGTDTPRASMVGRHTVLNAREYCLQELEDGDRKPSTATLQSCVARFMAERERVEFQSQANCRAGTIRVSGPSGTRTYHTPVAADCASGGATAVALFRMLCPSFEGQVAEGER